LEWDLLPSTDMEISMPSLIRAMALHMKVVSCSLDFRVFIPLFWSWRQTYSLCRIIMMNGILGGKLQALGSVAVLGLAIFGLVVLILLRGERLLPKSASRKPQGTEDTKDEKADQSNPLNVFPPSRRAALLKLLPSSKLGTPDTEIQVKTLRENQIPTTKVQPLNEKDLFTATSLLTQEIKALGRFPDYSVLSGVPHPTPAPSFDITKATFRPFRPFRWTYHQTMGQ
jgi:hypothetical protein